MGSGGYHSSRAEFLSDEAILKYNRNGGCFVTTKKAIAFVIFALGSLLLVVLLMYFYGPTRESERVIKESNDIEKLINDTLSEKIPREELRLPKTLLPTHYKLQIHPILDEYSANNFTFTGRVEIDINCMSNTNKIILHWDDLNITDSDIKIYTMMEDEHEIELQKMESAPEQHNLTKRDIQNPLLINSKIDESSSFSSSRQPEASPTETVWETTTSEWEQTTDLPAERIDIKKEPKPVYLQIQEIKRDQKNYRLFIKMKNRLEKGKSYTINIKFAGEILSNLKGLYKTSYIDLDGNTRWLATTHFQPIYARRVFPCFDEPYFKAPFEVSVARRKNMTVLSNMPVKETVPFNTTGDWVWDHFQQTPPMSTYILAFTVSDLKYITMNNTGGPEIRLWGPESDLPYCQYALEVANEILPFMENYFGMKFPMPKLDMLAIPNFGKAAMENWGIISFRKSSLFFNPNLRSIRTKSFILAKIAHEFAHQWFGNLVTMDWWSDLWLNEGFGTFMAEVTITSLRPRWHSYSSVKVRDTYNTLYSDSLRSAHSMQTEVISNDQIELLFESIIYQKGSSVLKMLNYTLSEDVFKKGLQMYLKKFAYKTASQDDLWDLYTETAQNESVIPKTATIKALMNSWSKQSGYPLITLTRNYSAEYAIINQTKMTEDPNITSDALWYVPIAYISKNDSNVKRIWLENTRQTELNLTGISNDSWILLNIDETGFYRVNYDNHNWRLLVYQLRRNPNQIPVATRGQLIDDAFQLANSGSLNYTIAFDLVKYLYITEPNYIPWYSALRNLEELRLIISNYEYSGMYDNFLLKLVKPMFNELGTENQAEDTQNEKLLRLHILTSACKLRYGKCITWSRTQYYDWMQKADPDEENPIPIDYRYIAQCTAIKSGGPLEWDFLWNRTLSPTITAVDLQTAYLSLGCSYDPWLINRYLEYSLNGNISLDFVPFVWQSIRHSVGIRTGFQFLRLNWERINDAYQGVYLVFSSIFHDFLSQLSTEIDLEDLTTFYKLHQNDLKPMAQVLQNTVDWIKVRISWKTKHLNSVINWLKINRY